MNDAYTILVNSSDGFEDCWDPFFKLFFTYWANCAVPIILNTEEKDRSFAGLNIRCSKVQAKNPSRRLTWSECLLEALSQIPTSLVLYFHEDYFIERAVDTALINEFANKMLANKEIKHIGLTHFGSVGPFEPTEDPRLWKISQNSEYRISTQAGLWQVETLKSYLRPNENGWMFEIYGTRRSRRRSEMFLSVSRDLYRPGTSPIIQYTHTGIIKGRWHPNMPALFKAHGIEVDFTKRGFYKRSQKLIEKGRTFKKLLSNPVALIKGIRGI